jgi:hypothetical protein
MSTSTMEFGLDCDNKTRTKQQREKNGIKSIRVFPPRMDSFDTTGVHVVCLSAQFFFLELKQTQ